MVAAAVLTLPLADCGGHHHVREPVRWQVDARDAGSPVTHVFGPQQAFTGNCDDALVGLVRGSDGTVYVVEQTCGLFAGYENRPHRSSGRPAYVMHQLTADGRVYQLPAPRSPYKDFNPLLLAVEPDGAVIGFGASAQLIRYTPSTGWQPMSAAQQIPSLSGHSGDGGPVAQARVIGPVAAAMAPDGALLVAEPFAVRRISRDGTITTVAGTDRLDPPASGGSYWGGRGSAGQDYPPKPVHDGKAPDVPLPALAGLTVGQDGTVWLVSAGVIYRVQRGMFSRFVTLPSAADTSSDSPVYHAGFALAAGPTPDTVFAFDGTTDTIYRISVGTKTVRAVTTLPRTSNWPGRAPTMVAASRHQLLVADLSWGLLRVSV